jgi:hypothetical protein
VGKVPVWSTVGSALGFTFGRYPAILGVVWLPLLLLAVCEYFVLVPMFEAIPALIAQVSQHPHDPADIQAFSNRIMASQRFAPALNLLTYLVMAWIAVGITKEAMGLRTGFRFVYLSVGAAEFGLLVSYLVAMAVLVGVIICFAFAAVILAVLVGAMAAGGALPTGTAAAGWAIGFGVLAGLAFLCALIYFSVRFLALIVPVSVEEKKFGLLRSWELSRGNFWRLFGIGFIIWLGLFVFELVIIAAFVIPVVVTAAGTFVHGRTVDAGSMALMFKSLRPYAPIAGLLFLAISPIIYGLAISPWAFAYRALVPEPRPDASATAAAA